MNFRNLQAGNLILLDNGIIGILTERFDMYSDPNRAAGTSSPCWCWRVVFNKVVPMGYPNGSQTYYNDKHGWSETNILNGYHGKVLK